MQPELAYIDRGLVFRGQNSQTVSIGFINWQNIFIFLNYSFLLKYGCLEFN